MTDHTQAFGGFANSAGMYERADTLPPFPTISRSGRGGMLA